MHSRYLGTIVHLNFHTLTAWGDVGVAVLQWFGQGPPSKARA